MKCVNLGCGSRYHPDWINIDIEPLGPGVIPHDLRRGIPLEDASCDIVYHAHLIEHIRRDEAISFIRECHRVLRPGGVLRVATPDLERIARLYLESLAKAADGDALSQYNYDWMMLEMYDQTVREWSGGKMLDFLRKDPLPNEQFILERIGVEGQELLAMVRGSASKPCDGSRPSLGRRLARAARSPRRAVQSVTRRLRLVAESDKRALQIGQFRLSGEVHHWMYDRLSLIRLLSEAGFVEVTQQTAPTSRFARWPEYHLDTMADGTPFKPDSFYMEGLRDDRFRHSESTHGR